MGNLMTADTCMKTEEQSTESSCSSAPCLFRLAQPWLQSLLGVYRGQAELSVKRMQVRALCICQECRLELWRAGLPIGADRYAWNGTHRK